MGRSVSSGLWRRMVVYWAGLLLLLTLGAFGRFFSPPTEALVMAIMALVMDIPLDMAITARDMAITILVMVIRASDTAITILDMDTTADTHTAQDFSMVDLSLKPDTDTTVS